MHSTNTYNKIFSLLLLLSSCSNAIGQAPAFQVDGAIQVGDSHNESPEPGTMRWTGLDFEVYNGARWVSLTDGQTASVTDLDGNTYPTVKIGEQYWFVENLRTSQYTDGSPISLALDPTTWAGLNSGAYCWYQNNNNYDYPHGKLYNWYATVDTRGLCPDGWKVPSLEDWNILLNTLGGVSVAGGKMKQQGTEYWSVTDANVTNESGFTAIASGSRITDGIFSGSFGYLAGFWVTDEYSATESEIISLGALANSVAIVAQTKYYGYQVRCVRSEND